MADTLTAPASIDIPGYVAGRWTIDAVHSDLSFSVRHLMVSKVRGHFRDFEGELVTAADPADSSVNVTIQVASVDTNNEGRNAHLRTGDFFEAEAHPTATYRGRGLRADGDEYVLDGELTLRGVTRQVPLRIELNGIGDDGQGQGQIRAGFTGRAQINRSDFGISFGAVTNGVVVVGDTIDLTLEVEAILQAAAELAA
jgi:polyisoprenoid-binding protein YceI